MIRIPLLPVAIATLALASYKKEPTPAPQPSKNTTTIEIKTPPAPIGQDHKVKESNTRYKFEFNYPAAADAIPQLKAKLDTDLTKQRAKLVTKSRKAADATKKDGFPFNPHSYSIN